MRSKAITIAALVFVSACDEAIPFDQRISSFRVDIAAVNGAAPPSSDKPLPANRGDKTERWAFTVEARTPDGRLDPSFEGLVRVSVRPGAVVGLEGEGVKGRNIRLRGGKAQAMAEVTAVYGPARLWIEDLGYTPAEPGKKPQCSNGKDDNGDVLIDYPADPGCAFADDDNEEGGSFAAGVSEQVAYALPTITDLQGEGPSTPFPFEAIEINATAPQRLVVTRIARDGFYVTDVNDEAKKTGYNSLFAFNFSTPPGMRVCDRVVFLAGTVNEFFGFTELSFPSYRLYYPVLGKEECEVPEPTLLDAKVLSDSSGMERLESGLARIEGYRVAAKFGSKVPKNNAFSEDASNCDLNGDGQVDFDSDAEGSCSNACTADPSCSEWTAYAARGTYKVSNGGSVILLQTGAAPGFDPLTHKGQVLDSVTGTLRHFSGGSLNWTLEARCPDDIVCKGRGCVPSVISSKKACVRLRSEDDNDQGTN